MSIPSHRVLVLEADEDLQRLFVALLGDEGYQAEVVTSVPAAVEALRANRPALVLVDMDRLGNQGGEFVRSAKAEFGESLPIVIVGPRYEAAALAEEAHADASLAKPFDISVFIDLLQTLTRGRP